MITGEDQICAGGAYGRSRGASVVFKGDAFEGVGSCECQDASVVDHDIRTGVDLAWGSHYRNRGAVVNRECAAWKDHRAGVTREVEISIGYVGAAGVGVGTAQDQTGYARFDEGDGTGGAVFEDRVDRQCIDHPSPIKNSRARCTSHCEREAVRRYGNHFLIG